MGWLASFGIGVLTAALGCVSSGGIALLAVDWYRVSSREGASGYFVVLLGLLGLVVGFVVGVVVARAHPEGFATALGLASAWTVGLAATGFLFTWLAAPRAPRAGGRELDLAVEVRAPAGSARPRDGDHSHAILFRGGEYRMDGLRVATPAEVDGRLCLAARVPVHSLAAETLGIKLGEADTQYLDVTLPRTPSDAWSAWLPTQRFAARKDLVPAGQEFLVRYRLQPRPAGE